MDTSALGRFCLALIGASWIAGARAGGAGPGPASGLAGCTSTCLDNGGYCVFGANQDNTFIQGTLFVNKRGIVKTGWEAGTTGRQARWTSRYGSVTVNMAGYQLAWGGMNEAGLMVSTLQLSGTKPPAADERPAIGNAFWVQYQLDNFATIEEVVASDSAVRVSYTVDHYFACDRNGDCATIEFLDGKMVVHAGAGLPVRALTNDTYDRSVKAWREGDLASDSLARFASVADALQRFTPGDEKAAIYYSFFVQSLVRRSITAWTLVFDAKNRQMYFTTIGNPSIRQIDLGKLDFSSGTPVQALDIHASLAGDITGSLPRYSHRSSLARSIEAFKVLAPSIPRETIESHLRDFERFPRAASENGQAD